MHEWFLSSCVNLSRLLLYLNILAFPLMTSLNMNIWKDTKSSMASEWTKWRESKLIDML
jgi:hypothetical protein